MKLFRINTTAFKEEDFYIMTDLTPNEITEVINPLVETERDGGEEYDNEMLYDALLKRYPDNKIIMPQEETLIF